MPRVTETTKVQHTHMLAIQATPNFDGIRTAEHLGQNYTIVPCVCLVEGVLWPGNAELPELALAEEFGRFPAGWNGRPVVMGHPKVNDTPVAANAPGVLEEFQFGQIFNTVLDGKKLKTEIWINDARVAEMGGEVAETVERLLSGNETVEISTGLFTMSEQVEGTFEGTKFSAVWRNIVPDHLAVLSEGTLGACSVEDGCGAPRTMEFIPSMSAVLLDDEHIETLTSPEGCKCGGVCDSCKTLTANAENEEHTEQLGIFATLKASFGDISDKWLFTNKKHKSLSDRDVRTAVGIALDRAEEDITFVAAVFQGENGSGTVVYEKGFDVAFFERSFEIAGNGTVTIGSKITEVRPETSFVPINVTVNAGTEKSPSAQESNMTKVERVAALIANEATKFTTDDAEWLNALEETQLEQMEPVASTVDDIQESQEQEAGEQHNDDGTEANAHSVQSLEEHLSTLPTEIREQAEEGIRIQRERKVSLIKSIKGNNRSTFSDETLEAMDVKTLQSIAAIGNLPDYSGQGVGQGDERFLEDESITPAPKFLENLKQNVA